jgi:hypothetical protein
MRWKFSRYTFLIDNGHNISFHGKPSVNEPLVSCKLPDISSEGIKYIFGFYRISGWQLGLVSDFVSKGSLFNGFLKAGKQPSKSSTCDG